ncbi:MAG: hypothetical protein JXB15_04940 [Anaerolineales bacterium]|nr:hypothetical protein [Anaerolineales bacterium]
MLNFVTLLPILVVLIFALGAVNFIAGTIILVLQASRGDVKTLAVQTNQLVQKGLAQDMVGLIGNATDMLDSINQLVRTARGVGIFLTVMGIVMMIGACWLGIQLMKNDVAGM